MLFSDNTITVNWVHFAIYILETCEGRDRIPYLLRYL